MAGSRNSPDIWRCSDLFNGRTRAGIADFRWSALDALVQNLVIGPASPSLFLLAAVPIIACGALRQQRRRVFTWSGLCKQGKSGIGAPLAVRKRFEADATCTRFIGCLFSGISRLAMGVGLEGVGGCIVRRFLGGGPAAVAALVGVDGRPLIRRSATGAPARKLGVPASWPRLRQPGNPELPPVRVVSKHMVG